MFSQAIFAADLPTWALLIELIAAGVIVIVAGSRLTRLADALAQRYHLGSGWVGLVLLATITSLPEVVTGGTATYIGSPQLATAAIFGSCSFNIVIIVLLNLLRGRGSILRDVHGTHVLTSSFGLVLMTFALLSFAVVHGLSARPGLAQAVEIGCMLAIAVTYLVCMRLTYRFEQHVLTTAPATASSDTPNTTPASVPAVIVVAAILVAAAWWLTQTGDVLSTHPIEWIGRPLGATFVGALFLACATSLPEIATSVTALRMNKFDLALGNIFGSNMFNIFVIPMLKVVSLARGDALLTTGQEFASMETVITGLMPLLLTGIAVAGLTYRTERRVPHRFELETILIGALYIMGMTLVATS